MRRAPHAAAALAACALLAGCDGLAARRLVGQWRSDAGPERTLDLFEDGSFSLRLSGKGLGFVSELLGPEKGRWRVAERALVLAHTDPSGVETTQKWPINELRRDHVVLAGERWRRVPP